mgnify:CR=1 FL=1
MAAIGGIGGLMVLEVMHVTQRVHADGATDQAHDQDHDK